MKEINKIIQSIKISIGKRKEEDELIREIFTTTLVNTFPNIKNPLQYISNYYLKSGKLYIHTTNKLFANDIHAVKDALAYSMNHKTAIKVTDIIIR